MFFIYSRFLYHEMDVVYEERMAEARARDVKYWSRSCDYEMRFTFVGDGDSSACNVVCGLNGGKGPYD